MRIENKNRLSGGRLLARNVVWNLLGGSVPILVAIVAVPLLIRSLGTERFGVLTFAWVVIGYFSLFDLGLGRALTQKVAEKLGNGQEEDIPALVCTSLLLMMILGLAGMMILGLLSHSLVHHFLKIPRGLQGESLRAIVLLALSVPIVISTAGLRGILEAHQRFGLSNVVRTSMGVLTFAVPLLVIPYSRSLVPVVAVLVGVRFVAWLATLWLCLHVMPALRHGMVVEPSIVGELIRFGSWMTATNIVGPLMTYLDRFIIGGMISVAAVAYYTTPSEMVSNLGLIPGSIVGVLFPAFAASFDSNRDRAKLLFARGVKYTYLTVFPVTLLIMAMAREGLHLWLGTEFAQNSFRVLQWLAFGRLLNCLAQVPFALVQGAGYPDFTGKLHLIELPFYVAAVWWLTGTLGIEGAAIAWVGRVMVDTIVLFAMAQHFLRYSSGMIRKVALLTGLTLLVLAIAILPMGTPSKALFLGIALLLFAILSWPYIRHETSLWMIPSIFSRCPDAAESAE